MSLRRDGHFAKALERAMRLAGVSQAQLARDCGVTRATVKNWLNGAEPSQANFVRLVSLFPELSEFAR